MNLKTWQVRINEWAISKGWNEDLNSSPDSIGKQITNMHSELSEAWEKIKSGCSVGIYYFAPLGADDTTQLRKPEGFGIELADCVIRILHTCEFYGRVISDDVKFWREHAAVKLINIDFVDNIGLQIMRLHGCLSKAADYVLDSYVKWDDVFEWLAISLVNIELLCKEYGIDLEHMMEIKQKYNETRSWRHGGKRA